VWLNGQHYGKTRLQLLQEASATLEAEPVINLIKDFRASQGAPSKTPSRPHGQVEPITRNFIKQFYQEKIRGKYKGREELAKQIQAKIDAAVASGKVLNK
jgi:hypothetical protein